LSQAFSRWSTAATTQEMSSDVTRACFRLISIRDFSSFESNIRTPVSANNKPEANNSSRSMTTSTGIGTILKRIGTVVVSDIVLKPLLEFWKSFQQKILFISFKFLRGSNTLWTPATKFLRGSGPRDPRRIDASVH